MRLWLGWSSGLVVSIWSCGRGLRPGSPAEEPRWASRLLKSWLAPPPPLPTAAAAAAWSCSALGGMHGCSAGGGCCGCCGWCQCCALCEWCSVCDWCSCGSWCCAWDCRGGWICVTGVLRWKNGGGAGDGPACVLRVAGLDGVDVLCIPDDDVVVPSLALESWAAKDSCAATCSGLAFTAAGDDVLLGAKMVITSPFRLTAEPLEEEEIWVLVGGEDAVLDAAIEGQSCRFIPAGLGEPLTREASLLR
mmetsp:Transcript_33520/g.96319  ORF Transcript_33520/g.96319 Transcript_33520/m.96319 type:complete len:248 (-) Transcript_33520:12-755(-)